MAAPALKLPAVGDTIAGRYRVLRVIAEGGMGVVFEVVHRRLDQHFAMKVLYPHYSTDPEFLARFDLEGRIASRLEGANVSRVIDIDTLPSGLLYMVMELLHGHDLEEELAQKGTLSIEEACDIVSQAAMGMQEAHALNVVHRDLKPANLFLCTVPGTRRRLVKVLDFGISRVIHDTQHKLTGDFNTLGTAQYMSPEQVRSASHVDARSDVWSLGVILYELLTGVTPFQGKVTDVIIQVATAVITKPRKINPDIPEALEAVIMRALERNPVKRFQSMGELAAALAPWVPYEGPDVLAQRVIRTAQTESMRPLGHRPPPRVGIVPASAAASLAGIALIVLSITFRAKGPAPIAPRSTDDAVSMPAATAVQGTTSVAWSAGGPAQETPATAAPPGPTPSDPHALQVPKPLRQRKLGPGPGPRHPSKPSATLEPEPPPPPSASTHETPAPVDTNPRRL